MNTASLMLTCLLWGQSIPDAQTANAPLGQRYGNSSVSNSKSIPSSSRQIPPGGNSEQTASSGLPTLPGQRAGESSIPTSKTGGTLFPPRSGSGLSLNTKATVVAADDQRYAQADESNIPEITLPGREPGDNVGANPFPAPSSANPLRGNVNDSSADQTPASQSASDLAVNNSSPNGSDETGGNSILPASQIPSGQSDGSNQSPLELTPRQFVPTGHEGSTFVPAVIDEAVVPAANTTGGPLVPVQPPENEKTAARLLREAFNPPELNSLSGQPLTLDELLQSQDSVGERQANMLRAYWQLCSAVAKYHWALQEQQILEQTIAGRQVPLATSAEIMTLRAKTVQARATAVDAQLRLAAFRPAVTTEELPLPVDRPVVSPYRTYYESLFASRVRAELSARHARRLHETLPLQLEAVQAWAEAVAVAEDLAQPGNNLTPQGQLDLAALAKSIRHLNTQRLAFLEQVQNYNQSIADYAILAASPGTSSTNLLPMLIKVKPRTQQSVAEWGITPQPSLPAEVQVGATEIITPSGTIVTSGTTQSTPTTGIPLTPSRVIQAGAEVPLPATSSTTVAGTEKQMRSVLVRSGVNR